MIWNAPGEQYLDLKGVAPPSHFRQIKKKNN